MIMMKKIDILIAALLMPLMLTAQPGRIGQPQMQPPMQRQPQMQPQATSIDAELQKLLM